MSRSRQPLGIPHRRPSGPHHVHEEHFELVERAVLELIVVLGITDRDRRVRIMVQAAALLDELRASVNAVAPGRLAS